MEDLKKFAGGASAFFNRAVQVCKVEYDRAM